MNDKEYTYDIDKYTIGVDENGEDGIGLTVAIIKDGGINFLGNCYGENARCIDLLIKENQELKKKYENAVADYETTMAEKNKLKKQLEEYKEQVNKGLYNTCLPYTTGYNKAIKDKETQQKEFIKYLEDEIQKKREKATTLTSFTRNVVPLKHCLQKYKSIIGVSDENSKN